jgi:hypothetical protein
MAEQDVGAAERATKNAVMKYLAARRQIGVSRLFIIYSTIQNRHNNPQQVLPLRHKDATMTNDELNRLWADDKNWNRWGLYNCSRDPRLIVPKRIKWTGWTANTAHGFSIRALALFALILVLALAPIAVVLVQEQPTWLSLGCAVAVSLGLVSAVCHCHASQKFKKRP